MKTKRYHNTRGWGRALSALLALALAVGLVLTVPPLDGFALADETSGTQTPEEGGALDLDKDCSLTLGLPEAAAMNALSEDEAKELTAAAVIDYYKIAEAVPIAGYDVYEFGVATSSPYYKVIKDYVTSEKVKDQFVSREAGDTFYFRYEPADRFSAPVSDWADLVEIVARACFDGDQHGKVPGDPVKIGDKKEGLKPGLYLTVVHGSASPAEIVDRATREPFTSHYPWYLMQQEAEGTQDPVYRCIASTNEQIYIFQPQLIALPGTTEQNGDGYSDTTVGEWAYDMAAVLKFSTMPHMASIQIKKTIEGEVTDPAVFVFRVAGTGADDNPYEDIRTIRVDKDNADPDAIEIAFNGIKAGSTVTVTEELSDANYEMKTEQDGFVAESSSDSALDTKRAGRTLTITNIPGGDIVLTVPDPKNAGKSVEVVLQGDAIGTTVTVSATNTHTTTTSTSGSVVNVFDPDEAATGWTWTKWYYENGVWNKTTGTTANTPNS